MIGLGERKAPSAFVNSCSRFLYLGEYKQGDEELPKPAKNIKSDTKLINLLRQAIEAVEEDDGWAMLDPIGKHISNHASFDQRNYGYRKLSELFSAIDLFESRVTHGSVIWIRDIKRARQQAKRLSS